MELLQGIQTRRSIRGFQPKPVPQELIRTVLSAAGRSASYTNTQPWEVAVVTGAKRDELSGILYELARSNTPTNYDVLTPTSWPDALEQRSKIHGSRRFEALGIGRGDTERRNELRLKNFQFFDAPCAMFMFMDSTLGPWSTLDMGIFLNSLTLSAHGAGLGCCLQASLAGYPDAIRDCLGIPNTKKLIVGMSMGYPDLDAPLNAYHSARMEIDEFVKWY
jgi:nitroreductase